MMGQRLLALLLLLILWPFLVVIGLGVWLTAGWPVIFRQRRVGYGGRKFFIWKFRTMRVGAEVERMKYMDLNEADGPVFKIKDDPRFVGWGKFLAHSGLDELPQLVNVVKGEMNLVGPRPLPVYEAELVPKKYKKIRESVKPGIISTWILNGHHKMAFEEWMKEDVKYVQSRSVWSDGKILIRSSLFFLGLIGKSISFDILTRFYR